MAVSGCKDKSRKNMDRAAGGVLGGSAGQAIDKGSMGSGSACIHSSGPLSAPRNRPSSGLAGRRGMGGEIRCGKAAKGV